MAKRYPCQQTRYVKCHKTVGDDESPCTILAVRSFLRNTLLASETTFKELIHGKNARNDKHDENVNDDTFPAKLILVFDWSKHAIPSLNSKAGHKKDGNFSHCKQKISVCEQAAKNLATYSERDWVCGLRNGVSRSSYEEDS